MFTPTFNDWPRRNRLLLYALLAMFAIALMVLYLYVLPKWRQFQDYLRFVLQLPFREALVKRPAN